MTPNETDLALAFDLAQVAEVAPYAELVARVAAFLSRERHLPISVERLAWLIAGLGHAESGWGSRIGRGGSTGPAHISADGERLGLLGVPGRLQEAWAHERNLAGTALWAVPLLNVRQGGEILLTCLDAFCGDERAALAAYRAGIGWVRVAVAAGVPPDDLCGGDYGRSILLTIDRWQHLPRRRLA